MPRPTPVLPNVGAWRFPPWQEATRRAEYIVTTTDMELGTISGIHIGGGERHAGRPLDPQELLRAALAFDARGWSVIPLHDKRPCPGVQWRRYQGRQPSRKTVIRWMGTLSPTGIGVVHRDGLCCRDFDVCGAFEAWRDRHPGLAAVLPTVSTYRGARVYFVNPGAKYETFPDGELIAGCQHYSAMPPSWHPEGIKYQWVVPLGTDVPAVDDLETAGFVPTGVTHQAHRAHKTRQTRSNPFKNTQGGRVGDADRPLKDVVPELTPEQVELIMRHTLPTRAGQRHRRLFHLMLCLRILGFPSSLACKAQVKEWFRRALPIITTKAWSETWEEFLIAWDNFDQDKLGLQTMLFRARLRGCPPELRGEEDDPILIEVAALCREYQIHDGDFFLSTHALGHALDVKPMVVWRKLYRLRAEQRLECLQIGNFEERTAGTYRWLGVL